MTQNTSSLKAADVLTDWNPTDVKSLLRLRLFDPPTFDRVRFHRRDVEAFLAAGHLNRLANAGNSAKRRLLEFLFTQTRSGRQIVIPSKQSIVVWLAQGVTEFNDIVRKNVIELEPELLLNAGDQQQYSIADKIQIIKSIVRKDSDGSRKSLSYSEASLRRFSTSALEEPIRSVIQKQSVSDSVCCLLISLIKEGKLVACGDLLEDIAGSQEKPALQRVLALQGLLSCEDDERLRRVAGTIVDEQQSWSSEVLEHVLADLVPDYIEVARLLEILRVLHFEGADGSGSFPKELQRISTKIDPNNENARELREGLARLITEKQLPGSFHYHPISEYAWLSPALSTLCLRQAPLIKSKDMRDFFFACMTAKSFRAEFYYGADDTSKLCEWVGSSDLERKQLFLWELEYTLTRFSSLRENSPLVVRNSFVSQISEEDEGWLTEIVLDTDSDVKIRLSALLEIIRAWNASGCPKSKIESFWALGSGDKILQEHLTNWIKEKNIDAPEEEWKEQQRQYDEKEFKRLEDWLQWRRNLVDKPKKYFSEEELPRSRHLLLEWLMADNSSNGSYQLWCGGKGIEEAFGKGVRDSASETFRAFWRSVDYLTFSERKDDQTGTAYTWLFGLTGLLAEADEKNWVTTLTDADINQATRLAMVEINGFPRFLYELAEAKPDCVAEVLGAELEAQLGMIAEVQHLPLLQDLTGGNRDLKVLLVNRLIDFILKWDEPANISEKSCGYLNHNFSQIFRIILEVRSEIEQSRLDALIERCVQRLRKIPLSQFAGKWFRVIFTTNAETATSLLGEVIESLEEDKRRGKVIAWLGQLFGDYQAVNLSLEDDDARARILARLIKIACSYVLASEDQKRIAGIAYNPNSRDEAESARSSLVNQLVEIPGSVADEEIQRLAGDPVCEKVGGYLKGRSEIREVQSADMSRFTISEIHGIETDFEVMPKDRDSLFRVMMSRLDDLQDNISHHDFVPRRTLQSIDSEEEMQRMLALLLQGSANGAYSIHREPEVADKKRTDIQFSVPGADVESVIEIKVAEKSAWTVANLLDALENQLVGKYLRYETRKAGCLLLTYGGYSKKCNKCGYEKKPRQHWQHPVSNKCLDFPELVELLQQRANELESERSGAIRLAVFGLDLRDPSNRS
ncbi:MAG: hypothetical protein L3J39_06920 [Verrucomicrobiales bacterium]|nr:hypothetical protein [Verrucomicrobiales bacterium]